jgi:cellulose synthase/poly-beta-1,6-N-acetylglucosamine synthase-like glycosyltransferase
VQLSAALDHVQTGLVVLTDADTSLHKSCISRLVRHLVVDSGLAIAGARVMPVTDLAEERFHWELVNALWYREGQAFGSAGVSGVCLGLNTELLKDHQLQLNFVAEDMELTLYAITNGHRSRIVPDAFAYEHRVPETLEEMIEFRIRRASGYKNVLLDTGVGLAEIVSKTLPNRIRRAQFMLGPLLTFTILITAVTLLVAGWWSPVAAVLGTFVVSLSFWLRSVINEPLHWRQFRTFMVWMSVIFYSIIRLNKPVYAVYSGNRIIKARETHSGSP